MLSRQIGTQASIAPALPLSPSCGQAKNLPQVDRGRLCIEKLQLVYHCEQVDIEHSDIMLDEQAAVY